MPDIVPVPTDTDTRCGHTIEHQGARGVDDIDALAAGIGHDPRLPRFGEDLLIDTLDVLALILAGL